MTDSSFADFMLEVDRLMTAECGLGVNDLADYDYSCAFKDECDPAEVVADVLAENNYPH